MPVPGKLKLKGGLQLGPGAVKKKKSKRSKKAAGKFRFGLSQTMM